MFIDDLTPAERQAQAGFIKGRERERARGRDRRTDRQTDRQTDRKWNEKGKRFKTQTDRQSAR